MSSSMNFKLVLVLCTMVTCLSCHFTLYAGRSEHDHFHSEEQPYVSGQDEAETQSNIAPLGTAYGWSGMASSTANSGQTAQPGLNDDNLTTGVDIQPNGDTVGAWEAAGVIWASPASITSVDFINGTVTSGGDGFLTANCTLQFSTDGFTWTNSGWTITPAYPNSASASDNTYTFSGPVVSGILGARVVGQVRTKDTSYHWIVNEVQVMGNIGTSPGNYTAQQIIAAVLAHMTPSVQVNTKPHINTMTRAKNVNVYEVTSGVYAYTSSMAIDDDGSDPNPDPDHQNQTAFQDSSGAQLGAAHVAFYVLGANCWAKVSPCPYFYYREHNIKGLQFALIFYKGNVIGAVFGDTQAGNHQTTSQNDSRELGEASVKAAAMLGIPDSGITGGVNNGVTVVIFSGSRWVMQGLNEGTGPVGSATGSLNGNAQAVVQTALNTLGTAFGL